MAADPNLATTDPNSVNADQNTLIPPKIGVPLGEMLPKFFPAIDFACKTYIWPNISTCQIRQLLGLPRSLQAFRLVHHESFEGGVAYTTLTFDGISMVCPT